MTQNRRDLKRIGSSISEPSCCRVAKIMETKVRDLRFDAGVRVIVAIEKVQDLQRQNEKQAQELHDFVAGNKDELQTQGLGQLLDADALYDATYHAYRTDLSDFMRSYKEMAAYLRDHAAAIQRGGTSEKKRYDVLFATYVSAMKLQNKAYFDHVAFLKNYATQHPSVSKIINDQSP